MKIQSIQNQQTQTKPNFSADLIVKKLPNLLGGVEIDTRTLCLNEHYGLSVVEKVLENLPEAFKKFVVTEGPKTSVDGGNLRHFVSPSGDKVVLERSLYKEVGERPIGLILRPADGSEFWIGRTDINFIDEPPMSSDKLFDDAAAILNKIPEPNASLKTDDGRSIFPSRTDA